jgi:hypothetical protein
VTKVGQGEDRDRAKHSSEDRDKGGGKDVKASNIYSSKMNK